jgi:serine/threonine-protein kinase
VYEPARYPRPFGKYLLLRQLAVGGMAEVYLARQSGPAGFEKECVIKRILPSLAADQQFVNMFLDEARIAARLSHPNIVQIYDLGRLSDQDYYLAMEHVPGVDLQQIGEAEKKRGGRVPLQIALRLIANVAEGLDHAHRATDARGAPLGIVHRDVTPSNVIVSIDGVAKILDFGIAKAVAKDSRTEVGVIKGKIPYMSPEQVQGEPIDARSDVFSLGTILYELTVGQRPFGGQNAAELSIQILHDEPSRPEVVAEGYPEALANIVRRAQAKRPQDRFQTAREMGEALDEFLMARSIRCTPHDVAAYLEGLFPGLKERTQAAADEAAAVLPIEVTAPTMPNQAYQIDRSGPTARALGAVQFDAAGDRSGRVAAPIIGDLSSPQLGNYEDVRRNLGGKGSGALKVVIVGLVLAVAAAFWFLTSHSPPPPAETPTTQPDKPVDHPKPTEAPKVADPTRPPEPAKEGAKLVDSPKPTEQAKEPPKPVPENEGVKAEKHHPHHAPVAPAPRPLPRLPTPPPPEDSESP